MSSITCMLAVLVVLVTGYSQTVTGQSYHFSNGWHPGKRAMQDPCHFRPEVKTLIFKLIEDEVTRMSENACYNDMPSLKSLLKKPDIAFQPLGDRK